MPAQTHFIPKPLDRGRKSEAIWAIRPAGAAIVFVHGFGGEAVGTWNEFQKLLPRQDACAGHDLVFFGYDGLYTQANASADVLRRFLGELFDRPARLINPALDPSVRRPDDFAYRSVLLVAHSLGAVICRRALLNAGRQGEPWVSRTSMVLFAPAHMGATNVIELGAQVVGVIPGIGRLLAQWGKFKYKPLQDLEQGSQTLRQLEADTRTALAAGAAHLVAREVLFGRDEEIVDSNRFCDDPDGTYLPEQAGRDEKDHTEVCKPGRRYLDPVTHVVRALQ